MTKSSATKRFFMDEPLGRIAMLYNVLLMALSCLAGLLGGVTGTGGIFLPPVLIEVFGSPPHVAMGTAQASYILPSGLAVFLFLRKGHFDWSMAVPLALSGAVCTFLAAHFVKPLLNGAVLTVFLGLCIIAAGLFMLKPVGRARTLPPAWRTPILVLFGAVIGVLSGVTGSGGNAILVPAMVACGMNILHVLSACQFFSSLSATFGTAGNMLHGAIDLYETFWLVLGQLVGIWLGVRIAQKINTQQIKRTVAFVCLATGAFVLFKSVTLLART